MLEIVKCEGNVHDDHGHRHRHRHSHGHYDGDCDRGDRGEGQL